MMQSAYDGLRSEDKAEKKTAVGLSREILMKLIFFCHPDKHGNSESSTEITKWLLGERQKL